MRTFKITSYIYEKINFSFLGIEAFMCRAKTEHEAETNFLKAQNTSNRILIIRKTEHITK